MIKETKSKKKIEVSRFPKCHSEDDPHGPKWNPQKSKKSEKW